MLWSASRIPIWRSCPQLKRVRTSLPRKPANDSLIELCDLARDERATFIHSPEPVLTLLDDCPPIYFSQFLAKEKIHEGKSDRWQKSSPVRTSVSSPCQPPYSASNVS